jgi:hypothetical protein
MGRIVDFPKPQQPQPETKPWEPWPILSEAEFLAELVRRSNLWADRLEELKDKGGHG